MKLTKKTLAIVLAGVMMACALLLAGCFGIGGGGSNGGGGNSGGGNSGGGNSGGGNTPAPSQPAYVGTWVLDYAHEKSTGDVYDLTKITGTVKLVVDSATHGTFYYFDDDPYAGTLERYAEQDSKYAANGYTSEAYKLKGSDGSYWELAFITPQDGADSFWYLEVGKTGQEDCLYLAKQ